MNTAGLDPRLRRLATRPAAVTALDKQVFAERLMAIERHLHRVAARLPQCPGDLEPATDSSDAVLLEDPGGNSQVDEHELGKRTG